jgi:hypothetical protein
MPRKRPEGVRKLQTTSKPRRAVKPISSQKDSSVLETKVLSANALNVFRGGLTGFSETW